MKQDFFGRQDSILKLGYILCLSAIAFAIPFSRFPVLVVIQFLFFLIDFRIILKWLQVILRLLPFFISLLIVSLILAVPFDRQLMLIARIGFVLLLSVLLPQTTSIDDFLKDCRRLGSSPRMNDLRLFLISVIFFLPVFYRLYQQKKTDKIDFSQLPEIIREAFSEIKNVEEMALSRLHLPGRKFDLPANLALVFVMLASLAVLLF